MTNEDRRNKIAELNDVMQPLMSDQMFASLRYNFLAKSASLSEEKEKEIGLQREKLEELNKQISIHFNEMRKLQVQYYVEYDGEVFESGIPKTVSNNKVFFLSTSVEIINENIDFTDKDVQALFKELSNYIYLQEYSKFSIRQIKRL